jgi:cytochrome P450
VPTPHNRRFLAAYRSLERLVSGMIAERRIPGERATDPLSLLVQARAAGRHRYAYLPFFGGQHLCLGKEFALLEAQLVLSTIAQHNRLALLPGHVVRPRLALTMGPRGGLPMTLHSR